MADELNPLTGLPEESLPDFLTRINRPSSSPYAAVHSEERKTYGPKLTTDELESYREPYKMTPGVNMEERRALNQGDVSAFANGLFRSVTSVAGDLIASPGYLFDYNQWMRAFKASEDPISNMFIDAGQSVKEWGDEFAPVYASQKAQQGFRPLDFEWWSLNLPSIASTLSLMIPAYGVGVGVTRGVAKGLQLAGKTQKFGKAAQAVTQGVSSAITSRHIENLMEGKEAYENIYAQALQSGKSEQEAAILAGQGATNVYRSNATLLAFDLLQYGKIFGSGLKYSSRADEVLKTSFMKELGFQVATEGAEEGFQFINQKAAEFLANRRAETGDFSESDFIDFLGEATKEAVTDPQFYSSMFLGGFGGGFFHAVGTKLGKTTRDLKIAADIDATKYAALKSGDLSAYQEATNEQFINMLTSSGSLGNMGRVINDLEAIKEDDTAQANLPEVSYENGKEITREELIDRRIAQAKRAEKIYDTVYDKYGEHGQHVVEALFKNAMKEELILDEIADRRENIFHLLADDSLTKGLSEHGKVRQEAKSRIEGINKWIKDVKSRDNSINTNYLAKDVADAQKVLDESIKAQTEEIAAETDPEKKKFLQSQLERDNSIIETRTDPEIGKNKARISELEEQLNALKKETKTIKEDPERERREAEKKLDKDLFDAYLLANEEQEKELEGKFKGKEALLKQAKDIKSGKAEKVKAEKLHKSKIDYLSKFITDSKIPETFKSKLPKTKEALDKLIAEYKKDIADNKDPKGHRAAIVKAAEAFDSGKSDETADEYDTIGEGGGVYKTPIFEERAENDFTLISHQFKMDPEIAKPSPRIGPHPSAHLYDWYELNNGKVRPKDAVEFVVRLSSLNEPTDPDYKYHQSVNKDTGTFIDKFQILVQADVNGKKVIVGSLRVSSSKNPKLRELRTKIHNAYATNVNRNLKTGFIQSNIFSTIKTVHSGTIGNVTLDKAAPLHTLPIFGDDFLLGVSRTYSNNSKGIDTPNAPADIHKRLSRTDEQSRMGTPGAIFSWIKDASGRWHPVQLITKRFKDLGDYGMKVINSNIDTIISSINSNAPLAESKKEVGKTVHLNFFFKKNPDERTYNYDSLGIQLPEQPVEWISTTDKDALRKRLTEIMLEQVHQVDFKSLNKGTYNLSLSKNGVIVTDIDPAYPIHSASVEISPDYTIGKPTTEIAKPVAKVEELEPTQEEVDAVVDSVYDGTEDIPTTEENMADVQEESIEEQIEKIKDESKPITSDIEAKKADIERRRQEELTEWTNAYVRRKNVEKFTSEYKIDEDKQIDLVRPGLIKQAINAKYDAELAALKGKKEESKSETKTIKSFKKLGGLEGDNPLKSDKSSAIAEGYPIDPASAKKWLEDRFGNRFGGFTDRLVSSNGVASYGLLRDGLIYLAKNAPRGTEYHEAFHLVFDYFLTPAQKSAIYKESVKLDGKPTKKELKEVERVYGKVGTQEAFALAIEERLAEQFREYVVREEKVTGIGPQIKRMFKRLLEFIRALISDKAAIDSLFFRIAFTRQYKSPITSMKHWRKYANALTKPNNKSYSIPGVHPFIQDDIKRALQFAFFNEVRKERKANDAFTNLSDIQIISKSGMLKKLYTRVYGWALEDYDETVKQYHAASGEKKNELSAKIDILAAVLTDFMKEKDGKAEMGDLANWLKRDLRNYAINISYKNNRPVITEGETPEDSDLVNESDAQFNSWEVDYISTSGKDTISYDVKKALQFIPTEKSNALGWKSFLDFDYIYPYLEFHLADLNDSFEMMEVLKKLSYEKTEAKSVYDALVADSDLKAKFFVNFAKTHANFYTVSEKIYIPRLSRAEEDMEAQGIYFEREKQNQFRIFNSNRRGIQNIIMDDWQYSISSGDSKISTAGAVDYNKASEQLKKLHEVERAVLKSNMSNEPIADSLVERIVEIMNASGLKTTLEEVKLIVIDEAKSKEAYNEWREWIFGGKSFKTVLGLMATKRFPGAENSVEGKSPFTQGDESTSVSNVANKIAGRRFNLTQASFRNHDNKTVYSYILPNFISKFFAQIHSDKASDFLKQYTNDPWFKDNIWLNQLMPDGKFNKNLAENFQTGIFESVRANKAKKGTGYSALTDAQFESTRINLFNNPEGNKSNKDFAWYMFPIPSDGTNIPIIKFQKYTQKEILEFLLKVKQQEEARIERVRLEQDTLPTSRLIKNYHYVGKPNAEGKKKANGLKYQYLPIFNEGVIGDVNAMLASYLEAKFKTDKDSYLNKLISLGIISKTSKDGKDIYVEEGKGSGESLLDFNFTSEGVEQSLRSYFYNQYLANIQMSQVFSVDLAYYKNLEDFHKRNKQSVSPAMKMDVTATYTDKNGNKFGVRPAYNALFVADIEFKSKHYDDIYNLFVANGYTKDQAKTWSAIYEDVNETDAQTYITLDRYREIMIGFGRWNDYSEEGYKRLAQGLGTAYDKDYVMNQMVVLQPIKPFSYSHRMNNQPNLIHPNQNKNSEFVLIPQMVNAKNPDGSDALPKLKALYNKMLDAKVDSVLFTSAVKVGEYGTSNLEEWVDGKEAVIHSLPNNDYGIQQATPEHHLDTEANEGTQIRKLVISDLPDDIEIYVPWQKKPMSKAEVVDIYQRIHEYSLETAFNEVSQEFESAKTIQKLAVDQIRDLNRGEEAEDALELEEVEVARDGKMVKEIRFKMPLWLKNGYSNEATLNAIIRKAVTKQEIQGGVYINVSTYGFSKRLNINFGKREDGTKYVESVEAVLPFWSKRFFAHIIDKDGNIDYNKLEKESPELLRLIGYRIPTEGKYSMYNIKVVGFSPYESGGHIILPSEATKITGLDFDVDKLFVMAPSFEAGSNDITEETEPKFQKWVRTKQWDEGAGTSIVRIEMPTYDEEKAKYAYAKAFNIHYEDGKFSKKTLVKIAYDYSKTAEENERLAIEDALANRRKDETVEHATEKGRRLARAGRNNAKLDIMRAILETPQASVQFLKGGGFDNLKEASADLRLIQASLDPKNYKTLKEKLDALAGSVKPLDPSLPQTQSEFFRRNMAGVALKGIFVNMNNNHSITQYSPLQAKFELEFDGRKTNLISNQNENGQYSTAISEVLASLVAAAVDNAKDPVLGFMNINTFTSDSLGLILRMGFPLRTAVAFLNQPSIIKVTEEYFNTGGSRKEVPNIISKLSAEIHSNLRNLGVGEEVFTVESTERAADTNHLEEQIKKHAESKEDIEYFVTQAFILNKFSALYEAAQVQGTINQSMTSDTKGAGPTMAANEVAIRKMDKVQSPDYKIQGAYDFLTGDTYRMVRAHAKYGVRKANDLLGKYFPWSKIAFNEVKTYLTEQVKGDELTEDEITYINYQIAAYYLSGHPFFDESKRKDIMQAMPKRLQKFKDMHKDDSTNPSWQFTNNLRVTEKEEDGVKRTRIEFINIGSAKGNQTDKFIKAWEDMLYTDFPRLKDETDEKYKLRNKAIHNLANDLVAYAFFSNGLEMSPFSFYHLIPNAFWKNTEVDGVSILSHLRELERLQDTFEFGDRLKDDFVIQMLRNRQTLRETNLLPYANTKKDTGNATESGGIITVPVPASKFPNGIYRGETKEGFVVFAPFIQYNKAVYYKESADKTGAKYAPMEMVGDPGYLLEYNYNANTQTGLNEEIDTEIQEYMDTPTSSDEETGVMTGDEFKQALDEAKEETGTDVYNKLGNLTQSENVVIKSWGELKNSPVALTVATKDDGKTIDTSSFSVVSTRIPNTNQHFGNPFSHDPAGKTQGLIKTETVREAVEKYIDWVINSREERAEWIREQLKSGKLKGKSILYFKELGEPSHATALDYLINKYDWGTTGPKGIDDVSDSSAEQRKNECK